jgi:hypothetical protein
LVLPGEAAAHGDDHGPVDDGLVVCGQALVVTDGASAAGDPGQGALDDPTAGQHLESVQVTGAEDDLEGELERGLGPGDELAGVDAVGSGEPDRGERLPQVPQQRHRRDERPPRPCFQAGSGSAGSITAHSASLMSDG